ncbi:putative tubulin-tyrosine ligase [Metarhizium anisopliae BRIP 53293]|uniref:Putative tubulin-tyrosine ligase n=1 Tax=Metarhizium anisopliae BRIP 53293 TaxID=1291518 RepID=A0A0D9P6M5_METAN|nr:putative tubulin-tyrosine ligase [Metarhizium anisopliae BRIP 53293]KJK95117.1 putative tubulin-tyrosine ligase [Metarhizium anisopliae BRIP 53284]
MHILVTNDDGPPSSHSSPYIRCLVKHLEDAGHIVSVCLPHTQRSWIGKAHMIGQTLKPTYYTPSSNIHSEDNEGTTRQLPSTAADADEWVLIDGTPASCVQIGLYHFFQDKGPIDLVISGPNYGRNTTSVFALSSGTLGAALEAAVCRRKAIALSFAFFSRNHDPLIIEAACRHGVRVIEALYKQWPTDESVDVYSVNVPLVEGVEEHKTLWADMLQNYWKEGSCFQEIDGDTGDADEEEARIRQGEIDNGSTLQEKKGHKHKHFKWAPRMADVYKSVEESGPGNDGRIIRDGNTSITPMKANFAISHPVPAATEFEFGSEDSKQDSEATSTDAAFQAIIAYEDPYVQPLIVTALNAIFPRGLAKLVTDISMTDDFSMAKFLDSPESKVVQIMPYESIDFEFAATHPTSCLINSYMIRKALIRKHYLSATVDHWVAKNPDSPLKKHVKRSESFEVDYAEFLDDALVEAFDLRESMDRNAEMDESEPSKREWWILKPGMSDRGQGIRLFSTMEELQDIFDRWEADRPDSDDDEDYTHDQDTHGEGGDYITTSHLRHFVAQPYIHPPLLLDDRKFHIRTYVLCTGSLTIHVYKHMLALFAAKTYSCPWQSPDDIESFLTNTCLQESPNENSVRRFWDLPLPQTQLSGIFEQICSVTGEVFEAAARAMPVHFQTLPNAFEVFGLDFMVDQGGKTWLLEINAFPDFKQTGGDLSEIVEGFWRGVMRVGVGKFLAVDVAKCEDEGDMVLARDVDLGKR